MQFLFVIENFYYSFILTVFFKKKTVEKHLFISETRSWVRNYKAIVLPLCCHLFIQIVFISSLSFFFSLPLDETRPISRHETRHFSQLIVVTNHFISINRVSIPYLDVARQLSDLRAIPPWMEIQLRENIESFPFLV